MAAQKEEEDRLYMGSHYSIIDARIVVRLIDYSYELN